MYMQSIPIPAKYCFHFANAFEDPTTSELVVDLVETTYLKLDNEDSDRPTWEDVGKQYIRIWFWWESFKWTS